MPKKRSPSLAAQGSLSQAPTESAPNVGYVVHSMECLIVTVGLGLTVTVGLGLTVTVGLGLHFVFVFK